MLDSVGSSAKRRYPDRHFPNTIFDDDDDDDVDDDDDDDDKIKMMLK